MAPLGLENLLMRTSFSRQRGSNAVCLEGLPKPHSGLYSIYVTGRVIGVGGIVGGCDAVIAEHLCLGEYPVESTGRVGTAVILGISRALIIPYCLWKL
jgi:hypothetical protein